MGWTSKRYTAATHKKFSAEHLAEFLRDEYVSDGCEFAMIHLDKAKYFESNHVCYALMRNGHDRPVFINVILINVQDEQIFWKDVPEDMGPAEDNCPAKIIQFAPPTAEKYAVEWRKACLGKNIQYNSINLNR